jgi:hypothetical protein
VKGMKKKDNFREEAALQLLTVLMGNVANPAKKAVFWADELIKELNAKERHNNSN